METIYLPKNLLNIQFVTFSWSKQKRHEIGLSFNIIGEIQSALERVCVSELVGFFANYINTFSETKQIYSL